MFWNIKISCINAQCSHLIFSLLIISKLASLSISAFVCTSTAKILSHGYRYRHNFHNYQIQIDQSLSKKTVSLLNPVYGNDNNNDDTVVKNVPIKKKTSTNCTTFATPTTTSNENTNTKELIIISVIEKQCGPLSTTKRFKQYLYRAKFNKAPLDVQNVKNVLRFLISPTVSNGNKTLVKHIILSSPRIIRRDVDSQLKPNVMFLKRLYKDDIFFQAITKNPDLLLISGVGYNKKKSSNTNKEGIDELKKENSLQSVESFLSNDLKMKPKQIKQLKQTSPYTFTLSVEEQVKPVLSYLIFQFLSTDTNNTSASITSSLISQTMASDTNLRGMIHKFILQYATILHLSVTNNIVPTIQFLKTYLRDSDNNAIVTLLKFCPSIVGLSISNNLLPKIQFLKNLVLLQDEKIEEEEIYYVEENNHNTSHIKSMSNKYNITINVNDKDDNNKNDMLSKCLCKHPQILALSLNNIKEKVNYFNSIDELMILQQEQTDKNGTNITNDIRFNQTRMKSSLARKIFISAPSTYSLSLKGNIVPKVEYLANIWDVPVPSNPFDTATNNNDSSQLVGNENQAINCNSKQKRTSKTYSLSWFLSEYPSILTLSLESNIQPTIRFFNRTGYLSLNEEGKQQECTQNKSSSSIVRGRHITSSLYNRLLPRYNYFLSNNNSTLLQSSSIKTKIKSDDGEKTMIPLYVLAVVNDQEYCDFYNYDVLDYTNYKKNVMPQLKFSVQFETWLRTGRPIDV